MSVPKAALASATVSDPNDIDEYDHDGQEVKTSRWRRIIGCVWDSAEGTPRNRKYVQKLDAYML